MRHFQPGIFDETTVHHLFLEFDLHEENDSEGPIAKPASFAFGHEVVAIARTPRLAKNTPLPNPFEEFEPVHGLEGLVAPATQHDLFIWLHSDRRDEIFVQGLAWKDALNPFARLVGEEFGFKFRDSRDLTGFVDGSANPKEDARHDVALIPTGECQDGSFVFVQRWHHRLNAFAELSVEEQQEVIGRTKDDSVELSGDAMPPDSHVSRTDLKLAGEGVKIYRRSTPAGTLAEPGLQFLAFSSEQWRFRFLLDSMFGNTDDDTRDHLLSYSTPITGAYYYAPPVPQLNRLFSER